mmetsp:Transcript_62447/g.160913  ORF Transcript_62447/g.160913 Transcript_62447/m.160913 type:complete len:290 (+) Transcript_62447:81-950(+)
MAFSLPRARSDPALSPAFNLRQFSQKKKLLAMESATAVQHYPLETLKEQSRRAHLGKLVQLQKQREVEERGIEAAEALAAMKAGEARSDAMKLAMKRARERKMRETNARVRKAEKEEQRKAWEEREERRRIAEERERLRLEEEEFERQRRAPWQCSTCSGSGLCQACAGKGALSTQFLVSRVDKDWERFGGVRQDFGTKPSGCEECGGCYQGIAGALQKGDGLCNTCNGAGMIWPKEEDLQRGRRSLRLKTGKSSLFNSNCSVSRPASPTSPTSAKTPGGARQAGQAWS